MDAFAFSDWANLPEQLLDSISERLLSSSDYLRFSAVTLINPFPKSKDRAGRENLVIRLPQLNPPELSIEHLKRDKWVKDCNYYVVKAIITADPILNANECIVVLIYLERSQMAFIRPGNDTTWTYLPTKMDRIVDVIQREDDKFYAIWARALRTFSITSEWILHLWNVVIPPNAFIRKYLVDSNGKDLLMVDRDCYWEDPDKETLGDDVAIFLGENLSICVVASNFPGCKQNCIYYNHHFDIISINDMLNNFGVYDMETKSISKPYSKHVLTLLEMINQRPIWFTPTFQL
ncbi:hypothetical protein RchiOBHm_Chr3g0449701 [Rosa chinensis]|uniref:KIB1-4 beta-propeller domain-containing protein n=1 Tax=Rosa chinensis TaxID=74649 RepID=A0A2P6R5K6_ROSCH|nr:hypothetical protein RchiOBHm_Chr3g0449701 [Rosa chinensis]